MWRHYLLLVADLPSFCCRWADNFTAKGCRGSKEHNFQHPFLQVLQALPPASMPWIFS
jgi:hypothetical protein